MTGTRNPPAMRSTGSKTSSTRRPTRASTSKVLPCKLTVAVLVTILCEEAFDLAAALRAAGPVVTRAMPSTAHARSSGAATKALPLSTLCRDPRNVDYADDGTPGLGRWVRTGAQGSFATS